MATKPKRADAETLGATAKELKQAAFVAVHTLLETMQNENNAPAVRQQAADSVLRHCLRYVEAADMLGRIAALEAAQNGTMPVLIEKVASA